jgi:hypothetical protein
MPTMQYRNSVGERVPGVTTVISTNLGWNKQALMWWANQVGQEGRSHRDVSGAAADAGTCAHYLIECRIKNKEPDTRNFDDDCLSLAYQALENFDRWAKTFELEVVDTEVPFVSELYGYGGCIDCPAYVQGDLCIVDWKTSKAVYPDHVIQLAAYYQGWNETNPDHQLTGGAHLLQLGKEDASFSHHWYGDLAKPWEAFKHLLELHKLKKLITT